MTLRLSRSILTSGRKLNITGSKSESNRLLILQALFPGIELENLSNADDVEVMIKALNATSEEIDIHHAGTAMRFLTAYFASTPGTELTLTGSSRMKERPIGVLVDALRTLGAEINYIGNEGFPPLRISGRQLEGELVSIDPGISSQYITAFMLIGSKMPNGLTIEFKGKPTSIPYIKMTQKLLQQVGVDCEFEQNQIRILPAEFITETRCLTVESDWSSASYFFSLIALSSVGTRISLRSYREDSLQGDSELTRIYESFGVSWNFEEEILHLEKVAIPDSESVEFDLVNTPDIAQTIAVTCLGLGMDCQLTGLHTLKIKETDRLQALKNEIEKFGGRVNITDNSLQLESPKKLVSHAIVNTYDDHRMAMAFAPLALNSDLMIEDAGVVSKSYPDYWEDLKSLGIILKQV